MLSGHFVETSTGHLYVTQFGDLNSGKAILVLPSFFEEMNLSRAVIAKQANIIAKTGAPVFCLDYFGTGDSEGDLEEANVELWQQNVLSTVSWLKRQGIKEIILWCVRAGALIGTSVWHEINAAIPVRQIIFWKPVLNGKTFMSQFIRVKNANAMMRGADNVNWRQKIESGESVEIAGYPITKALLKSIDVMALDFTKGAPSNIDWFEIGATRISPPIDNLIKSLPESQTTVHLEDGTAFWQVPEIFEQPNLYQATRASVTDKW